MNQQWNPRPHRERTTGSSREAALSTCGPAADAPEADRGFRVLQGVLLPSSSLVKGVAAPRCWLDARGRRRVSPWRMNGGARAAFPHSFCTSEGDGPAAEALEASEMQSVSPGLRLLSTVLSGVPAPGEWGGRAANDGLLK